MKLCREVWHRSSRARAVTWHVVSLPSHRGEIAGLIVHFLLLVPYRPQLPCGVMKRVLCPERASDVLGHTGSQVWASSCSHWEQVFLTSYYVLHRFSLIFGFVLLAKSEAAFYKGASSYPSAYRWNWNLEKWVQSLTLKHKLCRQTSRSLCAITGLLPSGHSRWHVVSEDPASYEWGPSRHAFCFPKVGIPVLEGKP